MLVAILSLFASAPDSGKVSEALGHIIGKHLEELALPLDLKALAKGPQDETSGKTSPLDEEACLQAIEELQKKKKEELSNKIFEAEEIRADGSFVR